MTETSPSLTTGESARQALLRVRAEVAKAVVGQDAAVAGLLVALLCRPADQRSSDVFDSAFGKFLDNTFATFFQLGFDEIFHAGAGSIRFEASFVATTADLPLGIHADMTDFTGRIG